MPAIYSDGLKFFSFSSLRLRAFAEFLFLIFAFLSPSRDSYCFLSVQIRLIRPIRVLFFSPLTTSSSFPPPQYAIRHTHYAFYHGPPTMSTKSQPFTSSFLSLLRTAQNSTPQPSNFLFLSVLWWRSLPRSRAEMWFCLPVARMAKQTKLYGSAV